MSTGSTAARIPTTLLVVPCYNEAARLPREELLAALGARPWLRLLLVDDGSTDRTWEVLEELAREAPGRIDVLRLRTNRGKAGAVREGVLAAMAHGSELLGYWDADLATPISEVDAMAEALVSSGAFIALGVRIPLLGRRIERSPARHLLGRLFAGAASAALGARLQDTQCGAKLFRNAEVARFVFAAPFTARWVFDVEILERLGRHDRLHGTTLLRNGIVEHPLTVWLEVGGSKLRPKDFARAALDLAAVAARTRLHGQSRARLGLEDQGGTP